ncbi:UDP-N-acetylmuramate dehydrogenase [Candidatus Gottesmanbacteria bacterium]|nr:UDP-N-acetylmuramate dehydrogenase [Candidatus Gottesmanbacteria bacterium]
MIIQKNIDLLPYNTFKIKAKAKYFIKVNKIADLKNLPDEPKLFLGEGANVLFIKDFEGLVIKNEIKGRKEIPGQARNDNFDSITIEVGSGENWHELVIWSVKNGWSGIENLALIPGTVGAAPVQNISAYGQQISNVIVQVNTLDKSFSKNECQFGYRESIFKKAKNLFITSVVIKLSKNPKYNLDYHSRYESLVVTPPYTPKKVAEAVVNLRKIKQPDWTKIGTAGSFFKNPVISKKKLQEIQEKIPKIQFYSAGQNLFKIPAGWLLDELGWKSKKIGRVGTSARSALVIINLGGATGQEILDFSQQMQADIQKNYGLDLEPEVNIIGDGPQTT